MRGLRLFSGLTAWAACRRQLWLVPVLTAEDREWMLSEALGAELQPLVYDHKVTIAQMV